MNILRVHHGPGATQVDMELWWVDWGRGISQRVCLDFFAVKGKSLIPKEFLAFLCWVDGFDQHSKQPNHLELWDGPSAPSCRVFVHGLRGWAGLVWPEYLRFVKGQEEHIPWQSPWLCLPQSRRLSRDLWEIQSLREGENVQEKRIVAWAYNQLWNIWDIKGKVTLGYSLFYWAFLEARYIIW